MRSATVPRGKEKEDSTALRLYQRTVVIDSEIEVKIESKSESCENKFNETDVLQ